MKNIFTLLFLLLSLVGFSQDCTLEMNQLYSYTGTELNPITTGQAPFTYNWSDGSTSDSLAIITSGSYCLTITDNTGCQAEWCDDVSVFDNLCEGFIEQEDMGSVIELNPNVGGVPPFTFLWSDGSTDQIFNAGIGTHCVTVTDAIGCVQELCIDVEGFCSVIAKKTGDDDGNILEAVVFGGLEPYSYTWNDGSTSSYIQILETGYYCVTIEDAIGCTAVDCKNYWPAVDSCGINITIDILENGYLITAEPFGVGPFSMDVTTVFSEGGYYSFTTVDSATLCQTIASGYLEDFLDCDVYFQFGNIQTQEGFNLIANPDGVSPYQYLWNTGETTSEIFISEYGNYTVEVIDSEGCSTERTFVYNDPSDVKYSLGGGIISANTDVLEGLVYLIQYDEVAGTLTAIDTIPFTQNPNSIPANSYEFYDIDPGEYLVKIALDPESDGYEDNLPTYYGDVLFWDDATTIMIPGSPLNDGYDINFIEGLNPGGSGFIGGLVSEGANFVAEGDPIASATILLMSENDEVVAYAVSGEDGLYSFGNLPWGTYAIYIEILGYSRVMNMVTIGPENPSAENLDFIVNSNDIVISSQEELILNDQIGLYPNPVSDQLFLTFDLYKKANLNVEITNVTGMVVVESNNFFDIGEQHISFETHSFQSGVYMVSINDGKNIFTRKFVKQ